MKAGYRTTQLQGITDLSLLAHVKTGFVPGAFNTVTYADRLTRVLRVLNAVRQASREPALQRSPFADSIGRFRSIHFFRFAVTPPAAEPGPHQLLLNVTFDGGWEPYMRIIWGPLGKLLDVMFCNTKDYPMAFQCSFDDYMRWVRDHEVQSSFFYADSAATVADSHYLKELEDLVCADGGRPGMDARAAGLALVDPLPDTIPSLYAVTTSLRVLKAFDGLRDVFPVPLPGEPPPPLREDLILLRFAQDLLCDLREWIQRGLFDPGGPFDMFTAPFRHEFAWLMSPDAKPKKPAERLTYAKEAVQSGIAEPFPKDVRHGALVLLRIKDVDKAKVWLDVDKVTPQSVELPQGEVYRNLALTYAGLRKLKVHAHYLDRLPQEFIDGMEQRAGVLGDLRCNHPEHWHRPHRNWPIQKPPGGPPIDFSSVHVLVQVRAALTEAEAKASEDGTVLVTKLEAAVDALDDKNSGSGLEILFVQPMRLAAPAPGEKAGRDHFGYVDGISQPRLDAPVPSPSCWSDRVKAGEMFLGYSNSRGDRPRETEDLLFDNSTFLVVRKLRQYPDELERLVADAAERAMPDAGPVALARLREEIKAKLMGRYASGAPTIKVPGTGENDFDFRGDPQGAQCPHRSHIRRANPRAPLPASPAPRIVRRGMSYVTPAEPPSTEPKRGIVFMAYNASIAEQFEVIQRWLAGGNSSGVSSSQDDPLLGVPEVGQRRMFRFLHDGKVVRMDLGDKSLVRLEWGVYAFVPSIACLKALRKGTFDTPPPNPEELARRGLEDEPDADNPSGATAREKPKAEPDSPSMAKWRLLLEDDLVREATWKKEVRDAPHHGVRDGEDYGLLVGSKDKVLEVLKDPNGKFSVCGYGDRMHDSIGRGFLGMDPDTGHREQSPKVNALIESIHEEEAFKAAFGYSAKYLGGLLAAGKAATGRQEASVDLIEYGRWVLAQLCTEWFGLPDPPHFALMKHGTKADDFTTDLIPRCPGHFGTVSRFIFSPHPLPAVTIPAKAHGERIRQAVQKLLDSGRKLTPLVEKMAKLPELQGGDLAARTIAGVMLGFPPTVLGNLISVLWSWNESMRLWDLQQDMPPRSELSYAAADAALRQAFLETMSQKPVPYMIWRTAATDDPLGQPGGRKGCPVVVGLGSAMADKGDPSTVDREDWLLMFGGSRKDGKHKTIHACPGVEMAMGVMLGCVAALLTAGTLGKTGDPRVLKLTALPK